ncbi:MAG: kelch repeat-containing protein [Planctomycetota bacterium]
MQRRFLSVALLLAALIPACGGGGGGDAPGTPSIFEVNLVTPGPGTSEVGLRADIIVRFTRAIDGATTTPSNVIVRTSDGREIIGRRTVSPLTPTLMRFEPTVDYEPSDRHTISISTAVRDTTGQSLSVSFQSSFTTEEGPPDLPTQGDVEDLRDLLSGGRWFHRATLLPNNRILVAGGYGSTGSPQPLLEVVDPFTGGVGTQPTPLLQNRAAHVQVLLDDGRVMLAGGETNDNPFTPIAAAERWNFQNTTSTAAAPMNFPRSFAEAVKLPDGRVLVVGGQGLNTSGQFIFRDDAEIYDPVTNTWTLIPGPASRGRSGFGLWTLSDGTALILGGTTTGPSAERLDPSTGIFSTQGLFPPTTHAFGAYDTLLDGRPIYVGGSGTKDITLFDETQGFLRSDNEMINERAFGTATALPDGTLMIVGGTDFSAFPSLILDTIDVWVPENDTGRVFRVQNVRLPVPTSHHATVLGPNGDVWIIGGLPSDAALAGRRQVTVVRLSSP